MRQMAGRVPIPGLFSTAFIHPYNIPAISSFMTNDSPRIISDIWAKPATIELNNFQYKSLCTFCFNTAIGCGHGCRFCYVPETSVNKFKTDLQRAEITYADPQGRKADFHALRYTFATNLSKAGVLPREAMELLRHSDMRLTMKTYTDAGMLLTGEAVAKLPSYVTPNGQIFVGPMAAIANTQIRTQTPISGGHKLAQHGTQAPDDSDS